MTVNELSQKQLRTLRLILTLEESHGFALPEALYGGGIGDGIIRRLVCRGLVEYGLARLSAKGPMSRVLNLTVKGRRVEARIGYVRRDETGRFVLALKENPQ